ncbi:MAG: phage repressor protein [Bacillota bacterium]|nr:MAG: phage repressor protein [Bacillota bacterium]
MENLSPAFERLGISFSKPAVQEVTRDVCWVNAKIMPAGEHVAPPVAEDYLAAPLVGEVGAGPGYLPQESVESWFLVYKHVPAIMGRRNLIAVEIGKTSTSMLPLLSPGDIVLVDRDDIDVSHAGHIMLVRDPEGAGMVKRVSVQPTPGGKDFSIQFYSDNAATNPPLLYSLREDYGGEISNAIVGRVIWAWSDVRGK